MANYEDEESDDSIQIIEAEPAASSSAANCGLVPKPRLVNWNERHRIFKAGYMTCMARRKKRTYFSHREYKEWKNPVSLDVSSITRQGKQEMAYSSALQELERDAYARNGGTIMRPTEGVKKAIERDMLASSVQKIEQPSEKTIQRILIHPDYAKGCEDFAVEVYSDVPNYQVPPDPAQFTYIKQNILPNEITSQPPLKRRCDCKGSQCGLDCPCVRADVKMNNTCYDRRANLFRHLPQSGQTMQEQQFYHARVMCGPECGCPPSCERRYQNIIVANKYEILMKSEEMGYSLRTLNNIREGEPITEFLGQVFLTKQTERFTRNEKKMFEKYSHHLSHPKQFNKLKTKLKETFADCITDRDWKAYKTKDSYVHPYHKGNIARFCEHSCTPNAVIIRVITNDVRLEAHHLLLVALSDISAGEAITIDYGSFYNKFDVCLCKSILCKNKIDLWELLFDYEKTDAKLRRKLKNRPTPKDPQKIPLLPSTDPIFRAPFAIMEMFYKNQKEAFESRKEELSEKYPSIEGFTQSEVAALQSPKRKHNELSTPSRKPVSVVRPCQKDCIPKRVQIGLQPPETTSSKSPQIREPDVPIKKPRISNPSLKADPRKWTDMSSSQPGKSAKNTLGSSNNHENDSSRPNDARCDVPASIIPNPFSKGDLSKSKGMGSSSTKAQSNTLGGRNHEKDSSRRNDARYDPAAMPIPHHFSKSDLTTSRAMDLSHSTEAKSKSCGSGKNRERDRSRPTGEDHLPPAHHQIKSNHQIRKPDSVQKTSNSNLNSVLKSRDVGSTQLSESTRNTLASGRNHERKISSLDEQIYVLPAPPSSNQTRTPGLEQINRTSYPNSFLNVSKGMGSVQSTEAQSNTLGFHEKDIPRPNEGRCVPPPHSSSNQRVVSNNSNPFAVDMSKLRGMPSAQSNESAMNIFGFGRNYLKDSSRPKILKSCLKRDAIKSKVMGSKHSQRGPNDWVPISRPNIAKLLSEG